VAFFFHLKATSFSLASMKPEQGLPALAVAIVKVRKYCHAVHQQKKDKPILSC
jgi:hypothetical protein